MPSRQWLAPHTVLPLIKAIRLGDVRNVAFREAIRKSLMPGKYQGRQVLLVEDTRFYSIAIKDRLETLLGVTVTHCATLAALRHLMSTSRETFALAILDLCQSDAPNGEALELVLSENIPSVVFSAISSDIRKAEILARNVYDYVAKSSIHSIDNLTAVVDRCLQQSHAQLLVIDSDENCAIADLLSAVDYFPLVVKSEEEAATQLDKYRNIELIMVRADVAAPNDFELITALQNRYGESTLRVVGYSKLTGQDDVARFLGAGGDDFVHLPISSEDLGGRLNHVMTIHKQIQALQRMASRDYLTDLLNRRYFFDRGPKIVDVCLRQNMPVSMALMDIDHFKRLNDTYGHEVGDLVLKAVSKRLLAVIGEKRHMVARLGGEEFGILYCGLDIQQAFEFCDHIREEIAKVRVVVDDEDLSVTVSMGLATISGAETFDNYLNAADQYLYLAKHSGRNQVFSDYQVTKIMAS
jgi:diguanylate cyclase (GGDEF)-like protein